MTDWLHRTVSGQSLTRGQLVGGGLFVLVWFVIDIIQFGDMVAGWLRPEREGIVFYRDRSGFRNVDPFGNWVELTGEVVCGDLKEDWFQGKKIGTQWTCDRRLP